MTPPPNPGARTSAFRRWLLFAVALLGLAGCLVLLPCSVQHFDGEGWVHLQASLERIGLALHAYHEAHGRLPPAIVRGENGQPL